MTTTLTNNDIFGAVQLGIISPKEARVLLGFPAEQEEK